MAAAVPEPITPTRPDSRPSLSPEREIERLRERVFQSSLSRSGESLASDGWVEPVRLGHAWSRPSRGPVTLIRASAAVTPAPWNVDRAVSLP
jgi:hypothetical protein